MFVKILILSYLQQAWLALFLSHVIVLVVLLVCRRRRRRVTWKTFCLSPVCPECNFVMYKSIYFK